jgi:MoxR-like ATPase
MVKTTATDVRAKFLAIRDELAEIFLEREELTFATLVAVLAKINEIIVGPPGTAKTLFGNEIARRLGKEFFYYLLNDFTTPEELFGMFSLKEMENDRYVRVTKNRLPEAGVGLLDEVGRSNSPTRNSLLTLINEGIYWQDGKPVKSPLEIVIGASNSYLDTENDAAFADRFAIKIEVPDIKEYGNHMELVRRALYNDWPNPGTTIVTPEELERARAEFNALEPAPGVHDLFGKLWTVLKAEGITASSRTWVANASKIVKAVAWLNGHDKIEAEDLEFLKHTLWRIPTHKDKVEEVVLKNVNPLKRFVLEIRDEADSIIETAIKGGTLAPDEYTEAKDKLTKLKKRLSEAVAEHGKAPALEDTKDYLAAKEKEARDAFLEGDGAWGPAGEEE